MAQTEQLKADQIDSFLHQSAMENLCGTLTTLREGKWTIIDVVITQVSESGIVLHLAGQPCSSLPTAYKIEQPVGLCISLNYYKYLFESKIEASPTNGNPSVITIDLPEKIEKMTRRAFERHPIPSELNVRAMFWHRGHLNQPDNIPEEKYWQGKMENLSVGGTMIRVGAEQRDSFSIGQLVGVQFTPMSYQKPLLLEGHVRHLHLPSESDNLSVGVEFLGLESSPEGREVLHRLLEVIDEYEKLNRKHHGAV